MKKSYRVTRRSSFVHSLLDPSAKTLCRSNALAQERKGIDSFMRVYV